MRRSYLALLLSLALAVPAGAEEDRIDQDLAACTEAPAGQTTAGMIACTGRAITAWDKRLNEVYRAALAGLDAKSQGLLRDSQRRWVAFRDAEAAALAGPWIEGRGSLARIAAMDAKLGAIRERVQELQVYVEAP